jgi:fructokinase
MRFGVDVGGTKLEAIALDGSRELARIRVDTPRDDYDATLSAIRQLVADLDAACGARGTVGVGIPGTISPATGLVKNANSVWLIGKPFQEDLERALARPVRIANDANCFAMSEAVDGAAAGARVVFGVIAGTGVGAGIVVDGRVLAGAQGIAGEWGHNPMPWPEPDEWPGPPCYCGKSGCIETFLSGPGLAADFARTTAGEPEGACGPVQPPEIVQLAEI